MHITKQQLLLFVFFGLLAAGILVTSVMRSSRMQLNQKMGIAEPSPLLADRHLKLAQVPQHGDYVLPYPGILPTHPLYPIKMIRDRLLLMATFTTQARAERLLLYANKRMEAANLLTMEGEVEAAVSVATKATDYIQQAIEMIPGLPITSVDSYTLTIKKSLLKHEEIVEKISAISDNGPKNQAQILYQRLDRLRVELTDETHQPFGLPRPEDSLPMK